MGKESAKELVGEASRDVKTLSGKDAVKLVGPPSASARQRGMTDARHRRGMDRV